MKIKINKDLSFSDYGPPLVLQKSLQIMVAQKKFLKHIIQAKKWR